MNVYEWPWKAHNGALGGRGRHWVPSWGSARTSICAAFLGVRLCWTVLQYTGGLIRCKNLEHLLPRLCLSKKRVSLVLSMLASKRQLTLASMLTPSRFCQDSSVEFVHGVRFTHTFPPQVEYIFSSATLYTNTHNVQKLQGTQPWFKEKKKPFRFWN